MKDALRKVSFGPASWALLSLGVASLIPLIETWHSTGDFPSSNAWITAALGLGLAALRGSQAIIGQVATGAELEPGDYRDAFLDKLPESDVIDGEGMLPEDQA